MPQTVRPREKAQSAMEYLMTYGWAILIIAVVLGVLFQLGVFSGGTLTGTSCVATSGYYCANPTLNTNGQLSFNFGQNEGYTIYNIELACFATSNAAGLPSNTQAWTVINGNSANIGVGAPIAGLPTTTINSLIANGITLVNGQQQMVSGVQCYVSTGLPLPTGTKVGTAFSGYVWVNYTTSPCVNGASGTICTWSTSRPFSVTLKVV